MPLTGAAKNDYMRRWMARAYWEKKYARPDPAVEALRLEAEDVEEGVAAVGEG
jgi:hypothetical protein